MEAEVAGAIDRLELPRVIGHRGAAAVAPENTLAGLREAKALGARWVEFDVKLTRDGVPILMHDERLERTTDGAGLVAESTFAALRLLDAGGWFGAAWRGERVPSFEEALEVCAGLGLGVNVELKPCPGREAETARLAVERLLRCWPANAPPPLISSFKPVCLEVARALAPELPRGYLSRRLPRRWRAELQRYGCATLHLNQECLRPHDVAAASSARVPLLLYTVNDGQRARELLAAGAAAVFTDDVAAVLSAVELTTAAEAER